MADAEFGDHRAYPPATSRGQRIVNMAGAAGSVALVVGLAWWGWDLAMRDARGVPIIRAIEGPMRQQPENPGGSVMDHQGLAVNNIAAVGIAAPAADRLLLAPTPVALTQDDAPGLQNELPITALPAPAPVETFVEEIEPAAPIEITTDQAVAMALAEALGQEYIPEVPTSGEIALAEVPGLEAMADPLAGSPSPNGMNRSMRPQARPESLAQGAASFATLTGTVQTAAAPRQKIDPSSLTPGTRLVQFGAYETPELAEAEWGQVTARFPDLMAGKAMVIQPAESGGRNFWRLRGYGFETEQESRRFCAALEAEGARCIPVAHR